MIGPTKHGWVKCATGELERLQQRLWYRRLKQVVITAVAAVAASGAVALAAWEVGNVVIPSSTVSPSRGPGVGCTRVIPCADDLNVPEAPLPKQ